MLEVLYYPLFLNVGMLLPITCIVAGLIGSGAFLIAKVPSLKGFIEKISPYQVGIGALALLMGLFSLVDFPSKLGFMGSIFYIGACAACIVLGLVLGFPALKRLFINDMGEEHRNKAEKLKNTLAPYQILSGVSALVLGIYLLFK